MANLSSYPDTNQNRKTPKRLHDQRGTGTGGGWAGCDIWDFELARQGSKVATLHGYNQAFFFFLNEEFICNSCDRVCDKPFLTAMRQGDRRPAEGMPTRSAAGGPWMTNAQS